MKTLYNVSTKYGIPSSVILEVTYRCNLRCIHCYVVDRKKKELTIDEYEKLLRDLRELGTLLLTVTGGEPLIRSDIKELLLLMSDMDFAIRLFTAGYYIDENFADFLRTINLLEVEMSIYGSKPDLHDSITRVPGSFKKLTNAVKLLVERGIRTNLKFVAMKPNYRDVLNTKVLAEKIGADFYYDVIITPRDDFSSEPLQLRLSKEEMREFYSTMGISFEFSPRKVDDFICNAGVGIMAISPYGEVFPCVQLRIKAGNIMEKDIADIWNNAEIFKFLRGRRLKDYNCGSCPLVDFCFPCIGSIWLERRTMDGCTEGLKNRAEVLRELAGEK